MTTIGWLRGTLGKAIRRRSTEATAPLPFAPELMSLLELARLICGRHDARVASAYVEVVTFASTDEIAAMLNVMLDEDWMALPVWARNLAFRLACLQRPEDAELLRAAAGDLYSFGPDWDTLAEDLNRRADALAAGQDPTLP